VQEVPEENRRTGGPLVVFVRLSETRFEMRPVRAGIRAGGFTEVAGVRPGEEVVTAGSHALKSELLRDQIESGD
jgi:hypothetical protein